MQFSLPFVETLALHLDFASPPPSQTLKIPFIEALWPWVPAARAKLEERLDKVGKKDLLALLSPQAYLTLQLSLVNRWSHLCTPSMFSEMKIEQAISFFAGEAPRERYLEFVQRRFGSKEKLSSFFGEYQELARLAERFLEVWVDAALEMLQRVRADFPEETIEVLKMDKGDFHNEGRAVSILTFSSGKERVYKPKSVRISETFYAFAERLNSLGLEVPLKGYGIFPKQDSYGEYGWEEVVPHTPCASLEDAQRYFLRAGMYMCLFYLLDGTDMHYENIIASGEYPFLIDLETLFHRTLKSARKEAAQKTVEHSTLMTGFLPHFFHNKKGKGIDISGLGREEEQAIIEVWENINTFEMALAFKEIELKESHLVTYKENFLCAKEYVETIVAGFQNMYTLFVKHHALLEKEGWFSRFAECPIRIVLRPTRAYSKLLQQFYSPETLLHAETREKQLNFLNIHHPLTIFPQALKDAEKQSLLQGDVPSFYSFPSSSDLFYHNTLIAKDCLEPDRLESILLHFQHLNDKDLNLQILFIRQAFLLKKTHFHSANSSSASTSPVLKSSFSKEEILSLTFQIAEKLKQNAFVNEDGSLGWISFEPQSSLEEYNLQPISDNLYSGKVGIALFFAALFALSEKACWKEDALNCLKPFQTTLREKNRPSLSVFLGIGGMTGVGGVLYGLQQMAKLLKHPELLEDAKTLLYDIERKYIESDKEYDLIFGCAGLILPLLTYYEETKDPEALRLAILCGEHLCKEAKEQEKGALAWDIPSGKPLLGLSHGISGIAFALLKLAKVTSHTPFIETARAALKYERIHFSKTHNNWPHLHKDPDLAFNHCSWCHGATGIGIMRLETLPLLSDPDLHEEIEAALQTTLKSLHNGSLSLCCGTSGRLAFLRSVQKILGKDINSSIHEGFSHVLHKVKNPQDSEEFFRPGFMQGVAGVGFALLSLLDHEKVLPNVLLLSNPEH